MTTTPPEPTSDGAAIAASTSEPALTRAQVADALAGGLLTPREAGALYPDMAEKAQLLGLDLDTRLDLAATDDPADTASYDSAPLSVDAAWDDERWHATPSDPDHATHTSDATAWAADDAYAANGDGILP